MNENAHEQVEIKLYKKRWIALALLICLIFQMIFVYTNFGYLNNLFVLYFNTTYATIDWLYLGWNIGTIIAALITSWLAAKQILTCRRSMIVASILQAINSLLIMVAFLQPQLLFLFIIGQVIGGISAAVLWSVPASLAQLWFPESQIGIATGMSMLGSSTGSIFGFVLPAHIVKYPKNEFSIVSNHTTSNSTNWMKYDKSTYQWLFLAVLTTSLTILILLLTAVPERPEKPPSFAQHLKRIDENKDKITFQFYRSEIKKLISDYIFLACGIGSSMLYYLTVLYELSIESMLAHILSNNNNHLCPGVISGYVLMSIAIGALVGSIAGGFILDKFKNYYMQSSIGATCSFIFTVLVLLSVYFRSLTTLFFASALYGVCTRLAYVSLIDSLMQHTYPTDPVFVMPFIVFAQNVTAMLLIWTGRQIIYHAGIFSGLGFVCVMMFLIALICFVFKPKTKRLSAEKSTELDEADTNTPLLSE